MNVAISNIAWKPQEDKAVLKVLKKYDIAAIEVAPTMLWEEPSTEPASVIKSYKKFWNAEGIRIESVQALLYGHPELSIFKTKEKRKKTLLYMEKMIQLCALLGVEDIVFGSPRNRDKGKLSFEDALDVAGEFFNQVGEIAKQNGIFFSIEPIPIYYGANFVLNSVEGVALVKKVNHPNFRLHLDSAAMMLAEEKYDRAIEYAFPYLRHMHISEKDLLPIGTSGVDHKLIAKTLKNLEFTYWLSIEMRKKENESNIEVIDETLQYVSSIYS